MILLKFCINSITGSQLLWPIFRNYNYFLLLTDASDKPVRMARGIWNMVCSSNVVSNITV